MGIIGMWTADILDLNYIRNYLIDIDSTAHTGNYSYKFPFSTSWMTLEFSNLSTIYGKFYSLNDIKFKLIDLNTTSENYYNASIVMNDGTIYVYRAGGTLVGSYTYDNTSWVCIEYKLISHSTAGEIIIKINGNEVINVTGIDTTGTGAGEYVNKIIFETNDSISVYLDDIVIRDDQWPGQGGLYVLKPNAGSTNENWTASAGNPEDCVDELPTSFTDYIYTDSLTPNTEHLVGIESLPASPQSIGGVGVFCKAQKQYSNSGKIRTLLKSGVITEVGQAESVDTGWIYSLYANNPDDAAVWENADIDALEIGVETQ